METLGAVWGRVGCLGLVGLSCRRGPRESEGGCTGREEEEGRGGPSHTLGTKVLCRFLMV